MILVCKDFEFEGKKLSTQNLSSLNFEDDTTLPLSLNRQMDSGEMNAYRPEKNGFQTTYSDVLEIDLHIAKSFDEFTSQGEMEWTPEECDTIVSWLTSPHSNRWMKITTENDEQVDVKGYFSTVEAYDNWGICYGIKCHFICNSPFSYQGKTQTQNVSGLTNFLVNNESSEYEDYVYPVFQITPTKNEDIFIQNMSDTTILENSTITLTGNPIDDIFALQVKIDNYATSHNLTIEYLFDENSEVKTICNESGLSFYMTDSYGIRNKYVAYYTSAGQYYICQGGFFYCTLTNDLNISVDCKNLGIYDSLGRPVLFTELDIQDEDEIYWPRLIHGNNTLQANGNFTIKISYLEPRKGLLI